jgi:glutamate N-acetyltransferase / amino-acid N-acetyltransferase
MQPPFSEVHGGVTAPNGFVAGAVHCGVKTGDGKAADLAVVYSRAPAVTAAMFTTNRVKAAPVKVSEAHVRAGDARLIIANSGNANACTGVAGIQNAKRMARLAARTFGLKERQALVCSTGRIGMELPMTRVEQGINRLRKVVSRTGSSRAARAIMTTDTIPKEIAVELRLSGRQVLIGAIAKGAGMIHPNMATMLCFITTDAAVGKFALRKMLGVAVEQSFNRITVDGDMSTNDTVIVMANGLAENPPLKESNQDSRKFQAALNYVTCRLARMIVEDGEGVTKCIDVNVRGAATFQDARKAAEAISKSCLVKCAWHGGDPNWGRIMDALGYSTAKVREEMVDIFYDGLIAAKHGTASKTPLQKLRKIVQSEHFTITVDLHLGSAEYNICATDLSTRYVELNMGE